VLLAVLSFLVNAIATLWSKAEFAKPYSLHSYFDPRQVLVNDQLSGASLAVLAIVTALATAAAYVRFARRDLPG
jgi:ABC-type transport system involved in multi-copper enzyme maturation permease subunit